ARISCSACSSSFALYTVRKLENVANRSAAYTTSNASESTPAHATRGPAATMPTSHPVKTTAFSLKQRRVSLKPNVSCKPESWNDERNNHPRQTTGEAIFDGARGPSAKSGRNGSPANAGGIPGRNP